MYHAQGLRLRNSYATFWPSDCQLIFVLEQQNPVQFGSQTVAVRVHKTSRQSISSGMMAWGVLIALSLQLENTA